MASKICRTCLETKGLSDFWVTRTGCTLDGYKNECKECAKTRRRAWAAKNREREQVYNRNRYLSDPRRYIEYSKQWRRNNPERYSEIPKGARV